ncbi:MAG: transglycosylase SLT domain-containing protein [Syntrophales bacterium]|nr:transglycosylase SLT domain-containing protein [Syntrophales bacterium]
MPFVIKWEQDTSNRKRYAILLLAVFVALLILGRPMLVSTKHRLQNLVMASNFLRMNENYQQKQEILKVLSQSDIQLGNAMEITQAVIDQSKKYGIPVSLFLAIMKKESNFNVDARSPVNAMGIMQVHPVTWDAYIKKMNLKVSRDKAFEPALNIMVSAAFLNDLKDRYIKKGYKDTILWDYVLSAYYAGAESVKGGLKKNHRYYVKKVREYAYEMNNAMS